MSESHGKSKRTKSGAKRKEKRNKIRAELGREKVNVTLGAADKKRITARGNMAKMSLKSTDNINVLDPKTGKSKRTKILTVLENAANRHYVRMNILSKGAIIKTELGEVRVTSRPGQDGVVNGVLVR